MFKQLHVIYKLRVSYTIHKGALKKRIISIKINRFQLFPIWIYVNNQILAH